MPETKLAWQRSRRCNTNGCIEVASLATGVAMRDSTRPDDPILHFTQQDWNQLLSDVRAGQLSSG